MNHGPPTAAMGPLHEPNSTGPSFIGPFASPCIPRSRSSPKRRSRSRSLALSTFNQRLTNQLSSHVIVSHAGILPELEWGISAVVPLLCGVISRGGKGPGQLLFRARGALQVFFAAHRKAHMVIGRGMGDGSITWARRGFLPSQVLCFN